jgi:hypothetical protein
MSQQKSPKQGQRQPQDTYAHQAKKLASTVQRVRGWVGSDPSRNPELADALVALTAHRLQGHAFADAATDAQESLALAGKVLAEHGPIGPYTSVDDAARYFTAAVHLAAIQVGAGLPGAAGKTMTAALDWEAKLPPSLDLSSRLQPATSALALQILATASLASGDVTAANGYADAALDRSVEGGPSDDEQYLMMDVLRAVADARWAAGRVPDALIHDQLAREQFERVVDGRLANPGRLAPGLLARLTEPLFGLYRVGADRLVGGGELDRGLMVRRWLIDVLRGFGKRQDDVVIGQLARSLDDLAADLRIAGREDEAVLVDEDARTQANRLTGDGADALRDELGASAERPARRAGLAVDSWPALDDRRAFAASTATGRAVRSANELRADLVRGAEHRAIAERTQAQQLEEARRAAAAEELSRREAERTAAERHAAERAEAQRLAAERAAAERADQDRLAAERRAAEEEAERLETKRRREERIEEHRREEQRREAERREAERLAAEQEAAAQPGLSESGPARAEVGSDEAERLELEQLAAELAELERVEAEQAEAERLAAEQAERERVERERAEAERAEAERLAAEQVERERVERERAEAERAEAELLAAEQAEREQVERDRAEAERLAAEQAERERVERERAEAERADAEQVERERVELERVEAERAEAERLAAEQAEREQVERERAEAGRMTSDAGEQLGEEGREHEQLVAEQAEHPQLEPEPDAEHDQHHHAVRDQRVAPEPAVPPAVATEEADGEPRSEPESTEEAAELDATAAEAQPVEARDVPDELDLAVREWQEAKAANERRRARAANERVVELLRPRAQAELAAYGPQLMDALEQLSSIRLRTGDIFGARAPSKEAKALAKILGR